MLRHLRHDGRMRLHFDTTVEAFVPGLVNEHLRSIWELGSMRVYDGTGSLFMTQGIFVP